MCALSVNTLWEQKRHNVLILGIWTPGQSPSSLNGKFVNQDAVSNIGLVLSWCHGCFEYGSRSYLSTSLRWMSSSFFPVRWWKEFHSLAREASLTNNVVGLSPISQWERPHDAFHMVVNLCQVSNSCSAKIMSLDLHIMISRAVGSAKLI